MLTRKPHVSASLAKNPEVMVSGSDNAQDLEANLEWPDAVVAGPGLFENYWSEQILYKLLYSVTDNETPTLLDAGALRLLAHESFSKITLHSQTVLTLILVRRQKCCRSLQKRFKKIELNRQKNCRKKIWLHHRT